MINLTGVSKIYGAFEALNGISFTIQRGEILGVLGHNGAGKTTTLRLLTSLIEPTRGEIEILDPEITPRPDGSGFKSRVGYLPDEPFLFPYLTGREMLYFMGSLYQVDPETIRARTNHFLKLLEIGETADRLIKTYSRGLRRKISLIGSLLHEPLYWFLDEPTESLDPMATYVLKDLIAEAKSRRRAIVVSTHQLGLAENLCDRLVILHQGSLIFDGTMQTLHMLTNFKLSSLEDIYFMLFGGPSRNHSSQDAPELR